jgi:glucans biosynthesis protein
MGNETLRQRSTARTRWGRKNPINRPLSDASHVSRCGAKTRAGTPCKSAPVRGRRRCRFHGGLSPSSPRGSRNGHYTNGDGRSRNFAARQRLTERCGRLGRFEVKRLFSLVPAPHDPIGPGGCSSARAASALSPAALCRRSSEAAERG